MKTIICDSNTKFRKFWYKNLFTDELEEVTEREFDELVIKFQDQYEMEYEKSNTQLFYENGVVVAKRSR